MAEARHYSSASPSAPPRSPQLRSIASVGFAGDFVVAANACSSTLAQGAACAIQVAFAPTAGGARSGTLTVVSNAANSPQTLTLSGAGVDFTLAADGASAVTVSSGQSAVFPLLLGSDAAVRGMATFSCSGAPANSVCTVFPATVALGSAQVVSVTVQTGVTTASLFVERGVWFALAVPVCFALRRRLNALVVLCCLVAASGCGSGAADSGGWESGVFRRRGGYAVGELWDCGFGYERGVEPDGESYAGGAVEHLLRINSWRFSRSGDTNIDSKADGARMRTELLRFNGAVEYDPAIDAWMKEHGGELGAIAREWFEVMRRCGDEVREVLHDGCPVACLGDAPFGYVNVFTSHVNVGFFHGATLPDPAGLLQGTGKYMRHVKLRAGTVADAASLNKMIAMAYSDIKARVENG